MSEQAETAQEAAARVLGPYLNRLARTIREDIAIAADLDSIRAGTFVPAPEPESGF